MKKILSLRLFLVVSIFTGSILWTAAYTEPTSSIPSRENILSTSYGTPPTSPTSPLTPTALILPPTVFEVIPLSTMTFLYPDTLTLQPGVMIVPSGEIVQETPIPPNERPGWRKLAETDHFEFYAENGYFPAAIEDLQEQAEAAFEQVSAQLGLTVTEKIVLSFKRPDGSECPVRGLATPSNPPEIVIFADERTSPEQIFAVLSHESAHIIYLRNFPEASHGELSEGIATWAARESWGIWQGSASLEASVRDYIRDSTYLPLYENYDLQRAYNGANCLEYRDILYTEWASFVGYLIDQYGMEKFQELSTSAPPDETASSITFKPPDYEAVYGYSLNQLEAAWLAWLAEEE